MDLLTHRLTLLHHRLLLFVLLLTGITASAAAQSAPPIGRWTTVPAAEQLVVESNRTCAFFFKGKISWQGTCSWNSSSRGGILTVVYTTVRGPAKMYFNIVWVDAKTLKMEGDVFHKQ
jgi:hypothetical protein